MTIECLNFTQSSSGKIKEATRNAISYLQGMAENPYSACAVGGRIKLLRGLRDLTQAELAQKAKVSRSDVSLWEIGKQRPSPEKADRVCSALEIELNYLMSGTTQYLRHSVATEILGKSREDEVQS